MKKVKGFKEFRTGRDAKALFVKDSPFKPKTIPDKKKYNRKRDKKVFEEPTNVAGGGAIAGIGVGPQGEPGITDPKKKKYKKNNKKQAEIYGRKVMDMF